MRSALRTTEVPSFMIPRRVHVVGELPLLGIGKIDRSAARRIIIPGGAAREGAASVPASPKSTG